MAQFGGQKNPPWATQFTATAVSQPAALGVQQPSLLGASPTIYTQQTALAAAGLTTQTPTNYQLTQSAALQQQAAAAAAALQQVKHTQRPALPELRKAKGSRRKGEWKMQYSQPQQTLYSVQQQLQQPQQTLLTQPAVALPTSLSLSTPQPAAQITVSYPAPRSSQQQTQPQKQRVFTGMVTKLHDTFGFVDEDVFFQLSAVKGKTPQVGDRVLVEATYNPNMPFKWNAQRIQTLPNQNQSQAQPLLKTPPAVLQPIAQQTFGVQAQPQPQSLLQAQISAASITPLLQTQPQPLLQQPQQKGGLLQPPVRLVSQPQPARRLDPPSRFSGRNDRGGDPMPNRKDDRSRERERERRRSRERSPQRKRSRERSPRRERERSPRRPRRVVPRYTVQFSKFSLDCRSCDMMELRRRYQNLYIPSDFFDAQFTWVDAFPMSRPFQLGNYCNFYVMHREVDPIDKNAAVLDPPDADHLYSAKVMLMASPSMEDLYHKSCALAEDPQELRDGFQHPARLVKFLVGMKGKDEAMAIGGHWSPSLDGPDPEKDPSVLIKTAIRCCKALTGIDLSVCTQWYRFAEIRYHRPEETHKGRTVPAHVETVVLFFPDVWHCLPTRSEWETLSRGYKQQLVEKLQGERKEADGEQDEEEKDDGEAKEISTPTHWSKLDPKTMKVNDLRKELESRTLSSKGLKSQLIARLTKQLKVEEQKEEQKELEKSEKEEEEEEDRKSEDDKEEEERKRQEELERQRRERRYILPDEPAIIVHPNWAAKSGKFDCSIMSLSVLLDYRLEDNKEHSFEVSLFAELFNEMLQRDFGVRIYKALISLPEREDKKDKKSKKDERKEKKEEKDDETDDPKPKRRKSGDDKDKKEERDEKKREDKRKDDSKDEEETEDDNNQEEYDPMEAEEAEDEDEECRPLATPIEVSRRYRDEEEMNKREDRREGNKHCKERASKDKEKDKTQMVTVNRDLLMAFVYFDQSHCGYLLEKDMEEILYTLGLHLSRAQVKKLLNKVVLRESCFYRRLTDTSKDEENQEESEELQEDMLGNRLLLPSPAVKQECKAVEENVGLIVYNGAMVDVGSLLQKLEKSERVRAEIEQKLQLLEEKTDEDEKTILQLENSNKSLSAELKEVKNDLGQLQEKLKTSDDKKLQFEGQLNKTIKNLATVMDEIQSVLKQDIVKNEDKDQKSKENGANV
ncbi:cell division cycle and apoptosis regulator protein 1 isoform X1 [Vidua macroura]|uniref:cell division cycle and apoptosis regulator protein 1 isoform X1 n=1 Tax=Vidua chalybeata TaxID=81927 RepID=UPI0023A8682F|nr:cell division cycle and apoptosis regulator protein 1 isoform X1 [Vidua chalybeata]XP_053804600.1 cell division cycle and apoptosis regulator protein 1 isoform X1 [Vidua chalybeata]XP_053839325.1 cell division cycle and apoptosis regulator protein 1 isoform X1 [Vidua macroura]XP_053839326.1 cell division cycle and apoptosis regulator protein 1 isoform X1 [Vidua macroura]